MDLEMDENDTSFLLDSSESDSEDFYTSESEEENENLSDTRAWFILDPTNNIPPPPQFPFIGNAGMKVHVRNKDDPLEYFNLFFDEKLIHDITAETNKYAETCINQSILKTHSRTQQWKCLTSEEFRCFLGLIILQGISGKPRESWFWSRNFIIETPFFRKIMSERRYSLIMKFLHFEEKSDLSSDVQNAKLKKIWIVLERLNTKFSNLYIPEQNITIHESLMSFRGCLSWIQYIPSKRSQFGIKYFALCESSSGYVWKIIIYTGKKTAFDAEYKNYGLATKFAMSLIKPLLNQGYCLTTDNFYTSPELAEILVQNRTDIYGTVRKNRKNMPTLFKNSKLKKEEILAFQKGKVLALMWRDKKDFCMLSTIHNADKVTVVRRGKSLIKPQVVYDYNITMSGVDKSNQCLAYYSSIRKGQKTYHKKIFRHLLDIVISNAFVLYKKNKGEKDHLEFRLRLIERLIEVYNTNKPIVPHGKYSLTGNPLRLTERHFPSFVPPTPCKNEPRRRCAVCSCKRSSNGKRVRKESRFECKQCEVGLCVVPCFEIYHTKEEF